MITATMETTAPPTVRVRGAAEMDGIRRARASEAAAGRQLRAALREGVELGETWEIGAFCERSVFEAEERLDDMSCDGRWFKRRSREMLECVTDAMADEDMAPEEPAWTGMIEVGRKLRAYGEARMSLQRAEQAALRSAYEERGAR